MHLVNDSLSMVLIGDWNKLYTQPEWFAKNVFEADEIEIGIESKPNGFSIAYKCRDVLIHPSQDRVSFTAGQLSSGVLDYLSHCINNFVNKAPTPHLIAYGINAKFAQSGSSIMADTVDRITDSPVFIENGYSIESTSINRQLKKEDNILNINMNMNGAECIIQFNEHHAEPCEVPEVDGNLFESFQKNCKDLLEALGYEMDGDVDE